MFHIEAGDEVDVFEHPNQARYAGQKIPVVLIEGYAYLVPFVESAHARPHKRIARPRVQGRGNLPLYASTPTAATVRESL